MIYLNTDMNSVKTNPSGPLDSPQLYAKFDEEPDSRTQKLQKLLKTPDFNFAISSVPVESGCVLIPGTLPKFEGVNLKILRLTSKDFNTKTKLEMLPKRLSKFYEKNPRFNFILVEGFYRFGSKNREAINSIFPILLNQNCIELEKIDTQTDNLSGFDFEHVSLIPSVIPTRNYKDSAYCLKSLAHRVQVEDRSPSLGRVKTKMPKLDQAQLFFVEGFMQCGPKKAKALLNAFDSPKNIVEALMHQPENIEALKGFGPEFVEQNKKLFSRLKY